MERRKSKKNKTEGPYFFYNPQRIEQETYMSTVIYKIFIDSVGTIQLKNNKLRPYWAYPYFFLSCYFPSVR